MKLLAIDTTEDACSAALLIHGAMEERFELAPRRHSELILPMMDELLQAAGLRLAELDALAFARGPGSFTGLRIAASIAQGAAYGAGLPVVPVSSLQALAMGAWRERGSDRVLAALDARMNEVYWGCYLADAGGIMRAAGADSICAPTQVDCEPGADWLGVGSGWQAHADTLQSRCHAAGIADDLRIHAQDVARIAAVLFDEGQAVEAEKARPVYLRDQVAWAKP